MRVTVTVPEVRTVKIGLAQDKLKSMSGMVGVKLKTWTKPSGWSGYTQLVIECDVSALPDVKSMLENL